MTGKGKGKEREGAVELTVNIHSDIFPHDVDTLAKLFDPKNNSHLQDLGGIAGLSKNLRTDIRTGLSHSSHDDDDHTEAARVEKYGENRLPPEEKDTVLDLVLEALSDKVMLILIGAAIISIILGSIPQTSDHPKTGWIDGVAILFAVVIVVAVNTINDLKKQAQFAKLDAKKNDRVVKALRNGEQTQISIFDVKVGDVLLFETGDIVCADCVVIDCHAIKADESAMTGESDPIKKVPAVIEGSQKGDPFLISGSQIMEGVGRGLVCAVGENSFNGRIAMGMKREEVDTPLQERLEVLATNIGKFGLIAAALLLLIAIPKYLIEEHLKGNIGSPEFKKEAGTTIVRIVISAITIVVVAVPEGLPLAVTIALAYGTIKMLADNNLVRHLAACETMGSATNICSDKTGTLTQNVMTVVTGSFGGRVVSQITDKTRDMFPTQYLDMLCEGISCNSNVYEATNEKTGKSDFVGSKTECALLKLARTFKYEYAPIRERLPIHTLYPFSSEKKRMSTIVKLGPGQFRLFTKGASEIVLAKCTSIMIATPDGKVEIREITPDLKVQLDKTINDFATDALRTICLAFADIEAPDEHPGMFEEEPNLPLIMVAIVGIKDPLRPEVPSAVRVCQGAGITVRMVTGDNIVTAQNIAKSCGILRPNGICLEGPKFRELSEKEMDEILPKLQVLARSSPTDKKILVAALQRNGEVVAVTGDGTNDGPALIMADVGFAMNIAGTEVAIAASDVVLLDDNFASITKAVLWGRNIFDAIRKFIQFQLSVNIVAVTVAFIGTLSGSQGRSPLTAVQLLWVNLIMDSMAALALATEVPTPDMLKRKPTGRTAPLITRIMWRNIIGHACLQLALMFALLYKGESLLGHSFEDQSTVHYTIVFNSFVFLQIFNEINARLLNNNLNPFPGFFSNLFFPVVLFITVSVQILFVTFGGQFTSTVSLNYWQWLVCVLIGSFELPFGLLLRLIPVHEPSEGVVSFLEEPLSVSGSSDLNSSLSDYNYSLAGGQSSSSSSSVQHIANSNHNDRESHRPRRWSLVREVMTKTRVISAFSAMKTYREEEEQEGLMTDQ
eukprot:TRINITY_DN1211_c0_g1_i1.p1 TRINITY_DN1211_c0_g1~~TRINITY_DN1211_c0_g1_i1.p1  ORF type:complete len:1070 (+),score=352.31 TRINITY_DN1211_c0_g1_i1:121-3330(+)